MHQHPSPQQNKDKKRRSIINTLMGKKKMKNGADGQAFTYAGMLHPGKKEMTHRRDRRDR
jgi:hypothetical protein